MSFSRARSTKTSIRIRREWSVNRPAAAGWYGMLVWVGSLILCGDGYGQPPTAKPASADPVTKVTLTPLEEKWLSNAKQVTFGLPRAGEGYFSPDGQLAVYQAYPIGYPFYQIYVQPLDDRTPRLISTGRGRTTCSYFTPDGKSILFASSHSDPEIDITELKAREEAAKGGRRRYQWDFDPHMDLYTVQFNGTGMKRLTDAPGYDAEGSYSPDGQQIVFTSTRDGDPDLYVMPAEGGAPRQLTNAEGYDGGPFFSPDGKWVIFRSDRLKKDMLQLYAISVDGKTEVQLTDNLNEVNWCPYFHPSGKYLIWSGADYSTGRGTFHLWTLELSYPEGKLTGSERKQITDGKAMDVLPVFSPDGKRMMWTSTRGTDGSSQLFIADWLRKE